MMRDADVLIVGAGPVGAAFALALARGPAGAGLAITLVESQPSPVLADTRALDRRALALNERSRRLLERIGAWPEALARRACPYRAMEVWDRASAGHVSFDCAEIHESRLGHIVAQPALIAALGAAVRAQPNIRFLCPQTLARIHRLPDGGCAAELNHERMRASLLVAADGPRSPLRERFGFTSRRWDPGQMALVAVLRTEREHGHCARQWFAATGPLAFLPLHDEDGDTRFVAIVWSQTQAVAERLHALPDDALCRELEIASEHVLGAISLWGERALIPLGQHHADSYVMPGIALLGDAAHAIHPLAGQGVNLGLADAEVLAEEVARALQRGLGVADAGALARYQRRRRPENLAMLAAMRGFKTLFGREDLPSALVRAAGMAFFDRAEPLKRLVMRAAAGTV
jgi:2-octaprenylphenol hydroxylase